MNKIGQYSSSFCFYLWMESIDEYIETTWNHLLKLAIQAQTTE